MIISRSVCSMQQSVCTSGQWYVAMEHECHRPVEPQQHTENHQGHTTQKRHMPLEQKLHIMNHFLTLSLLSYSFSVILKLKNAYFYWIQFNYFIFNCSTINLWPKHSGQQTFFTYHVFYIAILALMYSKYVFFPCPLHIAGRVDSQRVKDIILSSSKSSKYMGTPELLLNKSHRMANLHHLFMSSCF